MKAKTWLFSAGVILFLRPMFLQHAGKSATPSATSVEVEAIDRAAAAAPFAKRGAGSSAGIRAPAVRQPARALASLSTEERVAAILKKRDATASWHLDLDDSGRPFKIAGGKLAGVMNPGAASEEFLGDLQNALGFVVPASFTRKEKMTGNFKVVDEQQLFVAGQDEALPVFNSYVRYVGNGDGEAFLIQNELRPVDPDLQAKSLLTDEEAIEIARAGHDGFSFEMKAPAAVIFAHAAPHQRALQVIAKKDGDSRLLLIGQQTRTIVYEGRLSLQ